MTELGQRVGSALVLGPLVLLTVWWGNPGFALLVAMMAGGIFWEWNGITRKGRSDVAMYAALACVVAAVLLFAAGFRIAAVIVAAAGIVLGQWQAGSGEGHRFLWAGAAYALIPAIALVVLRSDQDWGLIVVLWLLCIVWASDIGAYFAGRLIGGAKLWPAVSPKKTWAGAIGGVLAAVVAGMGFLLVAAPEIVQPVAHITLIVILSAFSQLGDLAESALKRHFGVKDSSDLIPGHGGVMDRMDALVAAAVAAAAIGVARGGGDLAGGGVLLW